MTLPAMREVGVPIDPVLASGVGIPVVALLAALGIRSNRQMGRRGH